jgi:hypothetical protein
VPPVAAPDFAPAHCWVPPAAASGGFEAVELAAASGLILDPWQAWSLEQILGEHDDGSTVAFEAAVIVSRQNGKGAVLEALALYWLFLEEVELVLWSAHEFKTAAEAFRRLRVLLQGAPDLWPLVQRITTAKGHEEIELTTGQRLKFIARSEASGRGFTGNKIILDEAYDLDPDEMAALVPTLATVHNPQIIYTSSAGLGHSHVLRGVRDRGRAGGDPSLCWLEWCASPASRSPDGEDVYDLDDREQWARANPGKGIRITEGFIEKERRTMAAMPEQFARERLGVWDKPDDLTIPVDLDAWNRLDATPAVESLGTPVFFIDIQPGMKSAAIATASVGLDGRRHVELADHRPGAEWLLLRVADLARKHRGARFLFDSTGQVPSLLPDIVTAARGVQPEGLTAREMGQACGALEQGVKAGSLTHSPDDLFVSALAGAVRRDVGDGLWAWGRRKSTTDISPLVAATGALWALASQPDYNILDSVL